jgi:hypothetical protein
MERGEKKIADQRPWAQKDGRPEAPDSFDF